MTATHPIAPLRDRLKVILEAVSGIGRVYDYLRHPTTEAEIKSLFVTTSGTPRLHYWCVSLAPESKFIEQRYPGSHSRATVTLSIKGYYALVDADATEKTFINLVEDVLDALREHRSLLSGDIGGPWIEQGPAQWVGPNHVEVAGVLCHHAELVVPVRTAVMC